MNGVIVEKVSVGIVLRGILIVGLILLGWLILKLITIIFSYKLWWLWLLLILLIFIALWMLLLFVTFKALDGHTENEAIKIVKRFLGFPFKDDYTIISMYEETIPDRILRITISLPDDSFKEITTFLDTLKLEIEKTKEYERGWEKIKKTIYTIDGQKVEEDTNVFMKFYTKYSENGYRSFTRLTVDCDNKTLSYNGGSG